MKNIYGLLLSLAVMAALATSCMKDDDEIQSSPECVITKFTVGDIDTEVSIKLASGKDTIVTRTIGGSSVAFNIDQINNKIYSVDSLPSWVDISGVIPTINSTGYVYIKEGDETDFHQFVSGTDSVDFTKQVKFLVIATDGVSTKEYTAQIFKKDSEADSLAWKTVDGADLQLEGAHRTLTLADRIYVFSESEGQAVVTSSSFLSEGASWRKPAQLTCEQGSVDWNSVVAYDGYLYALNTEGHICRSTNDERGETWSVVSDRVFTRLLGTDELYLYACDESGIWGSADLQNWAECGSSDLDMLPETNIATVSYVSKTNPAMRNAVMCGLTSANSDNAVVWYKVSSANESINQKWNYVQVAADNVYACPKLDNLSIICHNAEMYAIGGNNAGIYVSADNGISWHLQTKKKLLPAEVTGQGTPASMVAGNGYLWLIQSGGKVWRGKIG
ncbi:MAG: hypothetical protein J6R36_03030 [Bacteroidaceae bacterium]|nr:hypothetical protein [Bacteroidaceae bacterium]